jgi:hypothetical protein
MLERLEIGLLEVLENQDGSDICSRFMDEMELNNFILLNFHLYATLGGWGRNTQTKIVFMDDWLDDQ